MLEQDAQIDHGAETKEPLHSIPGFDVPDDTEQYKARPESLRSSGNEQLAQQYENLYKLRQQAGEEGETDLKALQAKVDSVRREVRNLTVMGMDPSQPADQVAAIKQLEVSARAEFCGCG